MPLNVECPTCRHHFAVPDKMHGRGIKCPKCETPFTTPNVGGAPLSHPDLYVPASPHPTPAPGFSSPMNPALPPALGPMVVPPAAAPSNGGPFTATKTAPTAAPRRPVRRLTALVMDLPGSVIRQMPGEPEGVAGLSVVALVVGLVAWGVSALTEQRVIGLACSGLGLLLAGVAAAALLHRKKKGLGLPVAAALVNLQAGIFAAIATFGQGAGGASEAVEGPGKAPGAIAELRKAMLDPDQNTRLKAAFQAGELAQGLGASVHELTTLLKDSQHTVRAAAAEALGRIGPHARLGYPALLEAAQDDPEESVRKKALEGLKKIGPPASADAVVFVETLKDKSPVLRAAAAQCLRLVGKEAKIGAPALNDALKDPQALVRVSAAHALWTLERQEEVLQELLACLKDPEPQVRGRAALALADMRTAAQDALAPLGAALKDDNAEVRFKAAYALASIGKAARAKTPQLTEALKDDNTKVRLYAAQALWDVDKQPGGVPVFAAALKDKAADNRLKAAYGLWSIASTTRERPPVALLPAVVPLTEALGDSDGRVRGFAAVALGAIGTATAEAAAALAKGTKEALAPLAEGAKRTVPALTKGLEGAVPVLTKGLKDADPAFRARAAHALMGIGAPAAAAAPDLRQALTDDSREVRIFAAQALWAVQRRPAEVAEALRKILDEEKDGVLRAKAAFALGMLQDSARPAVASLNEALKDANNATLRMTAAQTLGKIGPAARITYPTLLELSQSKEEDPEVRRAAADAMKKIGRPTKQNVADLKKALADGNAHYKAAAVFALWMLHQDAKDAVELLGNALDDPDETVRRTAPFALAAIGTDAGAAVPALARALTNLKDDVLRARAAYALGEIGAPAKGAAEALRKALAEDTEPIVRVHAAQALWAIEGKGQGLVGVLGNVVKTKALDGGLRTAAAETLAKIGARAGADEETGKLLEAALPDLEEAAQDQDNDALRAAVTSTLGAMGYRGRKALPRLMEMLEDPEPEIRAGACEAVGKIAQAETRMKKTDVRAKVVYSALLFYSKVEQNEQVRKAANVALARVGRPGAEDVDVLLRVLEDETAADFFRSSAAQVLGMIGGEIKGALNRLTDILQNKTGKLPVRTLIAYTLGDLGPDAVPAIPKLVQVQNDKDPGLRAAVVTTLGEVGQYARGDARAMVEHAIQRAQGDDDVGVVAAAQEAQRKLKRAPK